MVTELLVPRPRIVVPKLPSYVKLDMAFGVGAGTKLFDKSRYRAHGDISGAQWVAGLHGYALDFVPTTPSYVEIPATQTQLNFTSEAFSIIMRIYLDTLTVNSRIFNRGNTNEDGYKWYIYAGGQSSFETYQSGAFQLSRSPVSSVATGAWYTIGCSRSGASVKLFSNGVDSPGLVGTHINPDTSTRSAKIGISDDKSWAPLDGKIEFLRVFGGVALSASEHLAWHNALA